MYKCPRFFVEEWVQEHTVLRDAQAAGVDLDYVLPIGIHGDDIRITKRGKMAVISVNCVTSSASTLDSRHVVTLVSLDPRFGSDHDDDDDVRTLVSFDP